MKQLNLVNLVESDIKFELSSFPDGQQSVTIKLGPIDLANIEHKGGFPVRIAMRINNFRDLEVLICSIQAMKGLGLRDFHLYCPYLLGCRSDRKFESGSVNYIKEVIAPIINSLGFCSVTVLDAHSDVIEACINNFHKEDNSQLVRFALEDSQRHRPGAYTIVSPDAGAAKKIYDLLDKLSLKSEVIICSKYRDHDGKLSRVEVPIKNNHLGNDLILIDDIGDGFGTFIKIAQIIKERANFTGKIYLIVTHSIQEHGLINMLKYCETIYTTNSYKDWDLDRVKVLNVF